MSARATALADSFEQTNARMIALVEQIPDAKWQAPCGNDGRSIGVVAHHVAGSHRPIAGMIQTLTSGQAVPPITSADIDEHNARHAEKHANCTREETLDLLRSNGASAAAIVRGLSDEQLAIEGSRYGTAEQIIERALIGHPQGHLQEIQSALQA